ncbi:NAD(P)-bd_dom domain-containing protein [Meloidogyne graminicola]|uniref:dTDP-D-glucose 4,6-dehydratase n=1 Tax=Meloidogyne graminicola TaxID=189291 RepID=A0A8S9ZG47_9BILA|nr:NAD(P)-bd_dom domain-containing protein [Meloidogyne graminicola]
MIKNGQDNLNKDLYNYSGPRNVLITGGCGFIGSNFINYIFDKWQNSRFINIDKLAVGASTEHIVPEVRKSGRYTFVHGTLLEQSLVESLLKLYQIDTVIHFAAITHVDESYSDRVGTIQENIIATTTLLEAINTHKQIKRFVHISTDEVYGDSMDSNSPNDEDSPLNPTNPYAASKAACEVIVRSYYHSYRLPYVMVRMNNVYGPRQAYSKLIPKFTRLALEGKPYPLMGDGMHKRSWIYVDDCAEAIRLVVRTEKGSNAKILFLDEKTETEFEKCNLHLTEMLHQKVQKLMNRESTKIQFSSIADRPYHDRRYHINFNKIRDELGWKCVVSFEEGLTRTLNYYLKEYNKLRRELTTMERPHG